MKMRIETNFTELLRAKGLRATYGRVALLEALKRAKKPLSVETAAEGLKGKLDLANTYRALEALAVAGFVRRVDVGHRHMHYELIALMPHHHHYVCEDCGEKQSAHA